jgi:Cu(I)/Ag(I) efflux system membrane protein CusA/SilA
MNTPPSGVTYEFSGTYENQIRAQKTLAIVIPLALFIIFISSDFNTTSFNWWMETTATGGRAVPEHGNATGFNRWLFTILYFQFKAVTTSMLVFSGIIVAWAGGFLMIWLYGQDWFMNFGLFGVNLRELFNMHPINLSVAIWVGFLALFGIASDDGVIMCTYLEQSFSNAKLQGVADIRKKVIEAGTRRVRPCLMTTATTILALIPVLTSTGRGSDIMVPMAIPVFGGMTIEILTMLVVPVLYSFIKESKHKS